MRHDGPFRCAVRDRVAGSALAAIAALATLALPGPARACTPDPYIGSICYVGFNFCPRGYARADGTLLAIASHSTLYSLFGTMYGGDGRTTFALPDLRGRVPVGIGTGPGLQTVFQGEYRGAEEYTMSVLEMPQHSHTAAATFTPTGEAAKIEATQVPANSGQPAAGAYLATATGGGSTYQTGTPGPTVELGGVSGGDGGGTVSVIVGNTGSSQPYDSLDPGLGLLACVAMVGTYPPRN